MPKRYETAADQVWKDKLHSGVSPLEALVIVILTATILVCGLLFGWL